MSLLYIIYHLYVKMSRIKSNLERFQFELYIIFVSYFPLYIVFHYYCKIASCRGNFDLQGLKRELENEFEG